MASQNIARKYLYAVGIGVVLLALVSIGLHLQKQSRLVPNGAADEGTTAAVAKAYVRDRTASALSGDDLSDEGPVPLTRVLRTRLIPPQEAAEERQVEAEQSQEKEVLTKATRSKTGSTSASNSKPPSAVAPPLVNNQGMMVLGYYAEDWIGDHRALSSLRNSMGQVDMVINFQLRLDGAGNVSTRGYPGLMEQAQAQQVPVQGLVHNMHGGRFDEEVARSVLATPAARSRAARNIAAAAADGGLSGINLDLENVPADLRQEYTALVKELYGKLKAKGLSLTLSVPAKTGEYAWNTWSAAFDYASLASYADFVAIMAYDEHLPGWSIGPIASVGWVEQVAHYAASQIPREKILLGVAAYGYDWIQGDVYGDGVSAAGAVQLAAEKNAQIQWDATAKVSFFTYQEGKQKRIVYFENARSLEPKLDIVRRHGLRGIAIWRLGLEDRAIWSVLSRR